MARPKRMCTKDYSPNFIRQLAVEYLEDSYVYFEDLAEKHYITAAMVSNLLFRGISECILSDKVSDLIFYKVVNIHEKGKYQRQLRWEKAFDARANFRCEQQKAKEQLEKDRLERERLVAEAEKERQQKIRAEIAQLENQLYSYDDYFICEEGAPTKSELQDKLNALRFELV